MNTDAITTVMESEDLLDYILSFLEYYDVSGCALVNKLFHKISSRMYTIKINKTLYDPFNELYKSTMQKTMVKTINVRNYYEVCEIFFDFIDRTVKEYWVVLIKDLEIMEKLFSYIVSYNAIFMTFTEMIFMTNTDRSLLTKIEGIKSRTLSYLYVEYPEKYNMETLKKMAKFKKIKGYYKMKRIELIKALERPTDELYFIETKSS